METASAAQIAGLFRIPFLGIRVLSNNITNGGTYDARTGEACQEFVHDVVKAYIGEKLKGGKLRGEKLQRWAEHEGAYFNSINRL